MNGRVSPDAAYLSLLLVAPVLYQLGITVPPSETVLGGVGPLALLVAYVLALVAWFRFRAEREWRLPVKVWFAIVILLWLYLLIAEATRGGRGDFAAIFIPATALLLWLKRPSRQAVWWAADAFAWSIVAASALVLVLEAFGLIPSWYQLRGGDFLALVGFDREYHWLPLADVLGLDGRWGGFMRDPNSIGPIGAALTVYGFMRGGTRRVVFAATGVVIVVGSDSRGSWAAAAFGLGLLVLLPGWPTAKRLVSPSRIVAGLLAAALGGRLVADYMSRTADIGSLTGRTSMWPDFLSLWPQSPILGVGTDAILEAVARGTLPTWASNGHNQYVDTLVRYGVVGLAITGVLLLVATAIAVAAARRGFGLGVAIMGTVIVSTVTNLMLDWRYPSVVFSVLVIAVVLSATVGPDERT